MLDDTISERRSTVLAEGFKGRTHSRKTTDMGAWRAKGCAHATQNVDRASRACDPLLERTAAKCAIDEIVLSVDETAVEKDLVNEAAVRRSAEAALRRTRRARRERSDADHLRARMLERPDERACH
eukprot:1676909-Pleurochrysis_carterae.AAC.2